MQSFLRRPHAQRGALACPIYFDGNPLAAEMLPVTGATIIPTPLDDLCFTDMGQLPDTEAMELPPGAGETLHASTGVCEAALYPDRIDLGHSFFTVAALLSIISVGSENDQMAASPRSTVGVGRYDGFGGRLERALRAAVALVERESFRLVHGFSADSLRSSPSLSEAGDELRSQSVASIEASGPMGSPEALDLYRDQAMLAAQEIRRARLALATETSRELAHATGLPVAVDPGAFSSPMPRREDIELPDSGWVAGEIRQRLERVERVLADANRTPAYAVVDPSLLDYDASVFQADAEYEAIVRTQTAAFTAWLSTESASTRHRSE